MALVLFGTDATQNPLHQDDQYQHVTIYRHLMVAGFELLEKIESEVHPESQHADCILFKIRKNNSISLTMGKFAVSQQQNGL